MPPFHVLSDSWEAVEMSADAMLRVSSKMMVALLQAALVLEPASHVLSLHIPDA